MDRLNEQMRLWSTRLRDDLQILPPESNSLASVIAQEVDTLPLAAKQRLRSFSPIPLDARFEELVAFQAFMDQVFAGKPTAPVVRAQVITQNYICFVYLGDACFKALKEALPAGSTAKKCCKFLTDNPVRALRNAIAHANWRYLPDFSGLEFWAKKGDDKKEPYSRFEVLQHELSFWQSLALHRIRQLPSIASLHLITRYRCVIAYRSSRLR